MTKARENGDGGLVLIGTASPTAASSVSFTNLTVGKRYRIMASVNATTSGASYQLRVRQGSTDFASGYYGGAFSVSYTGGTGAVNAANNASIITLGLVEPGLFDTIEFDYKLQSATESTISGFHWFRNGIAQRYFGYMCAGTTTPNGISIIVSSGTFSGNIRIYEYR